MPIQVSVAEAQERILEGLAILPAETVRLSDCLGRVLAKPVISLIAHPPFDNSAMDGFAVCSQDVRAGETLHVVGTIEAGARPGARISPGQCQRIMTGAPVPEGADAVVMVEDTRVSNERLSIDGLVRPGQHVRRRGEHLQPGQVTIEAGTRIRASEIAMAAYLGLAELQCHRQPRVAILSSGDELVEPGQPLDEGQIYNSNIYALEAQLRQIGCLPVRLPTAKDDPEAIKALLRGVIDQVDAVVTSAGVSMGERDFTLRVLRELGVEVVFWKVAMRPGRPLGFGRRALQPFFALPGNPVSSMVTFELFCRPALEKMQGLTATEPTRVRARLTETIRKKPGMQLFYRCVLSPDPSSDGSGWVARTTGPQDSHLLLSLVEASGLMEIPAEPEVLEAGSNVSVRLWV
jgi:molybdopterin molybdotransferase